VGADGLAPGSDFEGETLRSEFGATFGLPLVADGVQVVVQVGGRRSQPDVVLIRFRC